MGIEISKSPAHSPRRGWLLCAVISVAAAVGGLGIAMTSPGVSASTTGQTTTFAAPGGLKGLDATLAQLLDLGQVPHTLPVNQASVNCGPPSATLQVGTDVECGGNSNVGAVTIMVGIEATNAKRFVVVEIGSALGPLSGRAKAADAACHAGGKSRCASLASLAQYSKTPLGGGVKPSVGTPGIIPCAGGPSEKPAQMTLYCADGGGFVKNISWTTWRLTNATGTANLVANDCKPNCVSGKDHTYRVTIALGKPVAGYYGLLFTSVKVTSATAIALGGTSSKVLLVSLPQTPQP